MIDWLNGPTCHAILQAGNLIQLVASLPITILAVILARKALAQQAKNIINKL